MRRGSRRWRGSRTICCLGGSRARSSPRPGGQAGRINLRRWTVAGGAFCDLDLDLRKAEIHGQRTALTVLIGFGNVDVYVPENVNVTVSGLGVDGHRRE
jgi:hypothetical protein